jgi:hypothetical protein
MNWSDERYVRVYTRDTADWLALSFDAQALFLQLLRKVDRAGVLELGRHGLKAAAIAIGQAALWARLEPALVELLTDGCLVHNGNRIVVPNFVEAQEAKHSDRLRQEQSRERRRIESVTHRDTESRNVTNGHDLSQDVTTGHDVSHAVTFGHSVPSVPCSAVPCSAVLEDVAGAGAPCAAALPLAGGSSSPVPDIKPPRAPSPEALEVGAYLLTAIRSHTPNFSPGLLPSKWARDIDLALRVDGRTVAQMASVIDEAHRSADPFWRSNLLSGKKLREKFDQLWVKAQQRGTSRRNDDNLSANDLWEMSQEAARRGNG